MLTPRVLDILSRREMENFLERIDKLSETVIISVTDPDLKGIDESFLAKAEDFLLVKFWDVDDDRDPNHLPISRETAREIAEFIWNNKERKFLINCEGGVSRSSAVALAVECILRDFGNRHEFCLNGCPSIIGNPRFNPNWLVFDRIVEEFVSLKGEVEKILRGER